VLTTPYTHSIFVSAKEKMKTLLIIITSATIISLFSLACLGSNDCRKTAKTEAGSKKEMKKLQPVEHTPYPDFMLYTISAL
jgi:hypothetical protein